MARPGTSARPAAGCRSRPAHMALGAYPHAPVALYRSTPPWRVAITYHPQSGWFEDTPLKGGTEEGCPLKGVHEGTFLIEAGHPAWNHSRASGLTVVLRLGLLYGLGSGLPHKTSSAPPQRRNGRACSSLTARGGGLPVGVIRSGRARRLQRASAGRTRVSLPQRPAVFGLLPLSQKA